MSACVTTVEIIPPAPIVVEVESATLTVEVQPADVITVEVTPPAPIVVEAQVIEVITVEVGLVNRVEGAKPRTSVVSYAYDTQGRWVLATYEDGTTFVRTFVGHQLTREEDSFLGLAYDHAYDTQGRRISRLVSSIDVT